MGNNIKLKIKPLMEVHWPRISEIYQKGIETGLATFETVVPGWEVWNKSHIMCCRFVTILDKEVTGWVALSAVSDRCCYGGVAEVSVYVDPAHQGSGTGSALLAEAIHESEKHGIWTLQAGIFSENIPSIKLHQKHGFRIVGVREKLGKLDNTWKDVVLMERRSKRVGIE
ncbi:MAG: phosphinothricin acetyltransferase [Bacteroides sp. SM23_62_1]|nr:MAG: phosphinothricin acetyltransferase [Bacteroides sp. SM23_62_1]